MLLSMILTIASTIHNIKQLAATMHVCSPSPEQPTKFQVASVTLGIVTRSACNDAAVNAALVNGLIAEMSARASTPGAQVSATITSCSAVTVRRSAQVYS
jgi:hypothetical protein